ncbi:hypothetical protein J6590_103683, partial [Homalodisca vitripennis]
SRGNSLAPSHPHLAGTREYHSRLAETVVMSVRAIFWKTTAPFRLHHITREHKYKEELKELAVGLESFQTDENRTLISIILTWRVPPLQDTGWNNWANR